MKRNKCVTKYIYIEDDCECPYYWTEDEDDRPCGAIEYVRADEIEDLRAKFEALKSLLQEKLDDDGYSDFTVEEAQEAVDSGYLRMNWLVRVLTALREEE